MKLLKTLALAIVLALIPSTAAFAGPSTTTAAASARYGSGSFTVSNAQHLSSGCYYHPYTVNLTTMGTSYWDVDIRITAPNGSIADLNYIYGTGSGSASFPEETFLCSSIDPAGTYTITGTVTTYDYYYNAIAETQMTPASFQVLPYVAPTPPPPPPPPTPPTPVEADVTGTVSSKKITRGLKLTFKTKALPVGTVVGERLSWKVMVDGKTRKKFTQGPSDIRRLRVTSAAGTGQHKVKILRNGKATKTYFYRA